MPRTTNLDSKQRYHPQAKASGFLALLGPTFKNFVLYIINHLFNSANFMRLNRKVNRVNRAERKF